MLNPFRVMQEDYSSLPLSDEVYNKESSTFVNSIDRRTFNVGQDVMSKTGSVSELHFCSPFDS
jgi:hypothetical protein